MDNQNKIDIEKPKFNRKIYMKDYMKNYYKKIKVKCECGCEIFPHAVKQHNDSIKHKYLMISKEV